MSNLSRRRSTWMADQPPSLRKRISQFTHQCLILIRVHDILSCRSTYTRPDPTTVSERTSTSYSTITSYSRVIALFSSVPLLTMSGSLTTLLSRFGLILFVPNKFFCLLSGRVDLISSFHVLSEILFVHISWIIRYKI